MPAHSIYLSKLTDAARSSLIDNLWKRQSERCFLCNELIDLDLHSSQLHVDHIIPIVHQGPDDPMNFALMHAICNERKSSSNLEVARLLFRFGKIQEQAKEENGRGATLHDVLATVGGESKNIKLKFNGGDVHYSFADLKDPSIRKAPVFTDPKSGMRYFFGVFPIEYLHHDDRINPRTIGGSLKGLVEEFYAGRPQLHAALAWWAPDSTEEGPLKVFDGQHKAAAQILLGVKELPLRVFVDPNLKVLLQANTNAGDTLKQVAFDMAVKRHLGNALYRERLIEFRQAKGLTENDESFSEQDLISHFKGSRREMQKYVLDALRDSITNDQNNQLMDYVERAGKGVERPISYSAIEKTFFSIFLYLKPLDSPLNHLDDHGKNPRFLERTQLIRLMNLYAEEILQGNWETENPIARIENKVQQNQPVSERHLAAHRLTREEILHATLEYVALVIKNFYAFTGEHLDDDKLMQVEYPDSLWERLRTFLRNLRGLPCWIDRNLSGSVFGTKQSRDYWLNIFKTGTAASGTKVLTEPISIQKMIAA